MTIRIIKRPFTWSIVLAFIALAVTVDSWRAARLELAIAQSPVSATATVERLYWSQRTRTGVVNSYFLRFDGNRVGFSTERTLEPGHQFPVVYLSSDPSRFICSKEIPTRGRVIARYASPLLIAALVLLWVGAAGPFYQGLKRPLYPRESGAGGFMKETPEW